MVALIEESGLIKSFVLVLVANAPAPGILSVEQATTDGPTCLMQTHAANHNSDPVIRWFSKSINQWLWHRDGVEFR